MKRIVTTSVVIALMITNTMAQPGSLDITFGTGGKVRTAFIDTVYGQTMAVQQDGKIIVAGDAVTNGIRSFALARYNTDGTLDVAFGTGGKVTTVHHHDVTGSVALQPDGKILLCGTTDDMVYDSMAGAFHSRFILLRYLTNGTLDPSFGTGGIAVTAVTPSSWDNAYSLVVQSDLKIIVAGTSGHNFAFVRYHPDGSIDSTFNYTGILKVDFGYEDMGFSMVLQPDGKFVTAGYSGNWPDFDFAVTRCNPNGSIDSTFGTNGLVRIDFGGTTDFANSIVLQPDGKFVVAGSTAFKFGIVRLTASGLLDNTFSNDGKDTLSFPNGGNCNAACLQPDGKILLTGYTNGNFLTVRYNTDGTLDNTFGINGIDTSDFNYGNDQGKAVAMQQDGKILVAGTTQSGSQFRIAVARYASGIVGMSELFATKNTVHIYPNPFKGQVNLEYTLAKDETINGILYNMNGKQVQRVICSEKRTKGYHCEYLNVLESMPAGNYILVVNTEEQSMSAKIVKL